MTEKPANSLIQWTEEHLRDIFDAKTEAEFNSAFDAFLSTNAVIILNGKRTSRESYRKRLYGEASGDVAPATFNVVGALEVPENGADSTVHGAVGIFFDATLFGRLFVFGAHTSSTLRSSLNVEINEDSSLHVSDSRRVTNLNEVSLESPNPNLPPTK